ncbi:ABC transporter ATP-binding protein [Pararhizobium sp. YC-54]|uniref:ABC transporter ATP-binding protein n=1 Tax=Pararhizobium sp. YC-54 TaxID=2986920 RepID=UPI0035586848
MTSKENGSKLLNLTDIWIEGQSNGQWTPLVRGVNLSLHRGEVLGLIGESGAGKSTLGLAAMGFTRDGCRFSGGSVRFNDVDLLKTSEAEKRRLRGRSIAYVAQSAAASFNPAHRLISQHCEMPVKHGVMSRDDAARDGMELYRRMRLPNPTEIGFRYPHQVSGGQLQRAMTAMAMSCRPDLIIFDEPTTALDVTTQIEVLRAIRRIVTDFNTAAIYISHDLAVVAQMADRIKVLLRGEEVEEAETRTMLSQPKEDYTKSLWAVRSYARDVRPPLAVDKPALLQVAGVTASYGSHDVLTDISFDVHPARTVAVVGESGSGKSTIARVITGLLRPRIGQVLLDGKTLLAHYRDRNREELRQVQMIYQMADTALNPKLRLREIIGRPAEMYLGLKGKQLQERIRALLRMIELEPDKFLDRLPSELSGGQKQRVGIARALAAEPKLIICDEVTSALDQIVAEGVLKLLDRLQAELGLSYVFITHDLATVRAIADDVIVMQKGRVVEQGMKEDVFQPPHHPYTARLLASVPQMDPDWLTRSLEKFTDSLDSPQ